MLLTDHILFIDGEALIIDKPRGLPVDPPRDGAISLVNHLDTLKFGFQRWPVAVHRLDRDTSGCLLLARNPKAHARFQQAFEAGKVVKQYIALVDGIPREAQGVIDLPLTKHSTAEAGWRMVVSDKGKVAQTRWELLDVIEDRAVVRFSPQTGRTHQIRAHATYGLGAPIMGDPVYGTRVGRSPMMLHAQFLSVARPNKAPAEARAPLPPHFIDAGVDARHG